MKVLFSQIKMYEKGGRYSCEIKHDGKVVKSGWCKYAPSAYREATCQLVYSPGYVQIVPFSEYLPGHL